MSINSRLDAIKIHLGNAYAKISSKGGTVPANKNINNLANAIDSIEQGGGGPSDIRLNYPSLSFGTITSTQAPLIITNAYNGNFVESYDFYIDDVLTDTISADLVSNTINLKDYISAAGTYTIKVIAKATNFLDSNPATIVYKTSLTITSILNHCTTNNPTTEVQFGVSYKATLIADNGYSFINATVSITMGEVDITSAVYSKGKINIPSVTGNVVISAEYAVITQLDAPIITLSGSSITAPVVPNAEKYILCLNGAEWQEFDVAGALIFLLNDLEDYFSLTDSYELYIIARADGYLDSYESNEVTYTNIHGETPSLILNDNSWPTIRLICERGEATDYWSVGDTKTDVGTDGVTRTFRIADMQGLYGKHVVFEEVNCENETARMGNVPRWVNYESSDIRLSVLPDLLNDFSSLLKKVIYFTTYKCSYYNSSSDRGISEVRDRLFIASAKEVGLVVDGHNIFNDDTVTWEYYENAQPSDRIKTLDNVAYAWWTRSIGWPDVIEQIVITHQGGRSHSLSNTYHGYAPCFAF